nr:uncharacterized protein LOC127328863 [Lolium perenne]
MCGHSVRVDTRSGPFDRETKTTQTPHHSLSSVLLSSMETFEIFAGVWLASWTAAVAHAWRHPSPQPLFFSHLPEVAGGETSSGPPDSTPTRKTTAEAWTERKKGRRSATAAQSLGTNSCAPCQPPRAREEASRTTRAAAEPAAPRQDASLPARPGQDARRPAPSRAAAIAATTAPRALRAGRAPRAQAKTEPPRAPSRAAATAATTARAAAEPAAPRAPRPRREPPRAPSRAAPRAQGRATSRHPVSLAAPQDGAAQLHASLPRLASRASCATGGARPSPRRRPRGPPLLGLATLRLTRAPASFHGPRPRRRTRAAPATTNGAAPGRRTGLR